MSNLTEQLRDLAVARLRAFSLAAEVERLENEISLTEAGKELAQVKFQRGNNNKALRDAEDRVKTLALSEFDGVTTKPVDGVQIVKAGRHFVALTPEDQEALMRYATAWAPEAIIVRLDMDLLEKRVEILVDTPFGEALGELAEKFQQQYAVRLASNLSAYLVPDSELTQLAAPEEALEKETA